MLASVVSGATDHELHHRDSDARLAMDLLINLAANDAQGQGARDALRGLITDKNTSPSARALLSNCAHEMCRAKLAAGSRELSAALTLIAAHAPEPPNGANGPAQQHALEQHAARKVEHAILDTRNLLSNERPVTQTELMAAAAKGLKNIHLQAEPIAVGEAAQKIPELAAEADSSGKPAAAWVRSEGADPQWLVVIAEPSGGGVQWHVLKADSDGTTALADQVAQAMVDPQVHDIDADGAQGSGAVLAHIGLKALDAAMEDADAANGVGGKLRAFASDWKEKDAGGRERALVAARSELLDNVEQLTTHEAAHMQGTTPELEKTHAVATTTPLLPPSAPHAAEVRKLANQLGGAGFAVDSDGHPRCFVSCMREVGYDRASADGDFRAKRPQLLKAIDEHVSTLPPQIGALTRALMDLHTECQNLAQSTVWKALDTDWNSRLTVPGGELEKVAPLFQNSSHLALVAQFPSRLFMPLEEALKFAVKYRDAPDDAARGKALEGFTKFMLEFKSVVASRSKQIAASLTQLESLSKDRNLTAKTRSDAAVLRDALLKFQRAWTSPGGCIEALLDSANKAAVESPSDAIDALFATPPSTVPIDIRAAQVVYHTVRAESAGFYADGGALLNPASTLVEVVRERQIARAEPFLRRRQLKEYTDIKVSVIPQQSGRDLAGSLAKIDETQAKLAGSPLWNDPSLKGRIFTLIHNPSPHRLPDQLEERLSVPLGRVRDAARAMSAAGGDVEKRLAAERDFKEDLLAVRQFIQTVKADLVQAEKELNALIASKPGSREARDARILLKDVTALKDDWENPKGFLQGIVAFADEATKAEGRYLAGAGMGLTQVARAQTL